MSSLPSDPAGSAVPMADVPPLESADEYFTEIPDGLAIGVDEQVAVLHALRRVQGAQLDPDRCQRLLIECAVTALRGDLGWLSLASGPGQDFSIVASVGMPEVSVTQQSLSGIGAQAARRHATLVVNDFERSTRTPDVARRQLLEGGVRSLICTPLVAGELIGLLCVARRSGNGFARRDGVLLGSLAAQGAMTINNGRIVAEIEHRATSLQAALSVGTRVHDSLLAGEGLSGAARVLAGALGRSVSIHQDIVVEEPRWFGPDGRTLTRPADHPAVHIDLVAAGEILGSIRVEGPGELDDLQRQAVDVASTAIVSELVARRRTEEAEWRLHGELLTELVSATAPFSRSLVIRARRRGVDLSQPATVMVLARAATEASAAPLLLQARTALRSRIPPGSSVLAFDQGSSVVLALPPRRSDRTAVTQLLEAVASGGPVRAGVGRAATFPAALHQAECCLALARDPGLAGGGSTGPGVVDIDDLGLLKVLLESGTTQHAAQGVRRLLGPVHSADQVTRLPLMETVEALCVAEGRVEQAARLCHVHVSTLRHRLERLAEVVDVVDGSRERLLELRVAFRTLQILRAAGVDPFEADEPGVTPSGNGG